MRSEPVPNAISVNFFGQYAGFFRSKLVCTEIFPPIYRIIYSPKLHFVKQIALFMSYVQVLIFFFSPGFKPTTSGTGIPHSINTAAHETFTKKLETLNKFGKFAKPNRKWKIPVYILVPVPNYFRGQKGVLEKYLYMVVKIPVYGGKNTCIWW